MNTTTASPEASTSPTAPEPRIQARPQPLCRPVQGRMLAGVAIGIARYLGIDVAVVRIVLVVLTVVGGAGVPVYLAGWLLIPEEGNERSIGCEFIQSLQARAH